MTDGQVTYCSTVSRGKGALFKRPLEDGLLEIGGWMNSRRLDKCVAIILCLVLFAPTLGSQASQQTGTGVTHTASKPKPQPTCSSNGTYVNKNGQTVPRPENCSSQPQGTTAQCRDGSYSFSRSRSGTCSHHGGVAKWL